jgi:DNA-binding HxlR family transcriptional regulator
VRGVTEPTVFGCPVEYVLDLLGGKWRAVLLAHLKESPQRYGELRRLVPTVSEKMLTQRLHELVDDGLVEHRADGSYALTARGDSLRPVLQALYDLGTRLAAETGAAIRSRSPSAPTVSRPRRRP